MKKNSALIAIFFLLLLLFNEPFVSIPKGWWNGVPSLFIYLIGVWLGIIILLFFFYKKK